MKMRMKKIMHSSFICKKQTNKTRNDAYVAKANNTVNKAIKNHFPCSSHSTKIRKTNGLLDKCYGENEAEEMTWDYCEVTVKIGLTQIDIRSEGGERANPMANLSTEF